MHTRDRSEMGAADASVRRPTMYACKSLKMQGNLCIEFYAQKCERNSIRGRRIFIGFPDKFAKPAFYAGLVGLDFTGDNRRGAPQRSNQCGDCYSTQKSVHKSGHINLLRPTP
jgi:hypothetical protein